jgi:hypothetical protein
MEKTQKFVLNKNIQVYFSDISNNAVIGFDWTNGNSISDSGKYF